MSKSAERRRYFRVTDLVGLNYRFLAEGELDVARSAQPTSLNNLLATVEEEISVILAALKPQNPELHRLMELFNQKINLAFGHGLADKNQHSGSSIRACQVSLSACGIAFPCREEAKLGSTVALDLSLYPSNLRLQLMATVISFETNPKLEGEDPYLVRADFIDLNDNEQEILVQHVIKRQAHQLKDQRESEASSSH